MCLSAEGIYQSLESLLGFGWRQNDNKLLFFRVPGTHTQRTGPQVTLYHMEHTYHNPAWALKV